jgi:hypothetical protein
VPRVQSGVVSPLWRRAVVSFFCHVIHTVS